MLQWEEKFTKLLKDLGIRLRLYRIYVNDMFLALKAVAPGWYFGSSPILHLLLGKFASFWKEIYLSNLASFWKVNFVLNLAPFFMKIDCPILHLYLPNLGRLPS